MGQQKRETTTATVLPHALARDENAERYVQGDLEGMVHLMEQAYSSASLANAIARRCRGAHPVLDDRINSLQLEALETIVESMGEAEDSTERALRGVVAASPLLAHSYRPALEELAAGARLREVAGKL